MIYIFSESITFKTKNLISFIKLIFIFILIAFSFSCSNSIIPVTISPEHTIDKINIKNNIYFNRVYTPVTIDTQEYLFLLDTGASITVLNDSIKLPNNNIIGQSFVGTVVDQVFSNEYRLKNATIGKLDIPESPTYIMPFNNTILAQGEKVKYNGILGVNTLKDYIIYLNIKSEQLYFLKSLPFTNDNLGEEYDLFLTDSGLPSINIEILNGIEEQMLIDTGATSSSLRPTIFEHIVKKTGARVADTQIQGASGLYSTKLSWLDTLYIAGLHHKDVSITKSSTSLLGMDLLSKYQIILDFPNRKLYLKAH